MRLRWPWQRALSPALDGTPAVLRTLPRVSRAQTALLAVARSGKSAGTVTVLVPHWFSSVRMADLIVVLEGGQIAEQGSHQDLMRRNGLYAALYRLQSRAYR
jgi:ABC-type multidrug transport system fused ATPase/permease subunit